MAPLALNVALDPAQILDELTTMVGVVITVKLLVACTEQPKDVPITE